MATQGDLWIRGGEVIDPARGFSGKADVLVKDGKIIDIPEGETVAAKKIVEADGMLIVPGLIDNHLHGFYGGTSIGIQPDSSCLPQGVTTAVDQGSAGINNFENFMHSIINCSQVRIFAYLHVAPAGLATLPYSLECVDPRTFDVEAIERLLKKYPHHIAGLKIRQSKEIVGKLGLTPLIAVVKIANQLGKRARVVVHTTNAPESSEKIAERLRPGDIFAHVYQGKGNSIIDVRGKVLPGVRSAQERGVLFDTADGRGHYAFSVARAAIHEGFRPNIISTDTVKASVYEPAVFGMPLILSKYLNLGISLENVIKACTATPAKNLGMEGKLGTLAAGAYADIAIFKLKEMEFILKDIFNEKLVCHMIMVPQMTIGSGRILYRNIEFF